MIKYLIDINLPYRFSLWHGPQFVHQRDLDERWPDDTIWQYALEHNLTIITKDKDFADRIVRQPPPPRVILIRAGNRSLRELHELLTPIWQQVLLSSATHKLVQVFPDRIDYVA